MKKNKHLRVRITEEQFRFLANKLIEEQKNKSVIIREAIQKYLLDSGSSNITIISTGFTDNTQ
jgi:predicted DNA-binding protein